MAYWCKPSTPPHARTHACTTALLSTNPAESQSPSGRPTCGLASASASWRRSARSAPRMQRLQRRSRGQVLQRQRCRCEREGSEGDSLKVEGVCGCCCMCRPWLRRFRAVRSRRRQPLVAVAATPAAPPPAATASCYFLGTRAREGNGMPCVHLYIHAPRLLLQGRAPSTRLSAPCSLTVSATVAAGGLGGSGCDSCGWHTSMWHSAGPTGTPHVGQVDQDSGMDFWDRRLSRRGR